MRQIKAIVYGVGAMNTIATRMMLEKGVTIVGALARSPAKVGRDLGDLTGLGREIGVVVDDDPERVLSTRSADVAMVAVSSYMMTMREHLLVCARHGVNVVTLAEEALFPWSSSPTVTAELDRAAKASGVTITGTGYQDAFWVNLVAVLMGSAHRIDAVNGEATWNVDDYGPEVARDQRVGDTLEDFQAWLGHAGRPPTWGRNVLEALLAWSGMTATSVTSRTDPVVATEETRSGALEITVPAGHVIGFTDTDEISTAEGPRLRFQLTGRLYGEREAHGAAAMEAGGPGNDDNQWTVSGEPDLRLLNPEVPGPVTTCAQYVNRIPDVIAAEPGFVTVDRLPQLRYRAFPLGQYLPE